MSQDRNAEAFEAPRGLTLLGLTVGIAAGFAIYGLVEFWVADNDDAPLPITVVLLTASFAAGFLLLAERGRIPGALAGAAAIALLSAAPDYFMASIAGDDASRLTPEPAIFWFVVGRGLSAFLLITLVKAALTGGAPPPYSHVFFHGVTMPLILAGAVFFAWLALMLLFAWASLLKELDVEIFNRVFQEPWFILPFLGGVGGLSIGFMRSLQTVIGALRMILLAFCKYIALPITVVFAATFLVVLATKGAAPIYDRPYPAAMMLGLAFAGMLIFNGVYQDGENGPPAVWLRLLTAFAILAFPVYVGLAFHAFLLRINDYGLTPPRIIGIVVTGLAAAYSFVGFAGLLTELNWRGRRWMPLVGSFNKLMAAVWAATLIAIATPFVINPWALSAKSQYDRIASEKTPVGEFDFGYLHFKLGRHGDKALEKMLTLTDHPEFTAIRAGAERARAARTYWEYQQATETGVIIEPLFDDDAGPLDEPGDAGGG